MFQRRAVSRWMLEGWCWLKWEGRGGIIILPPAGLSAPLVLRSLPCGKDGRQEATNISLIEWRIVF